jgi:HSP20 family protein
MYIIPRKDNCRSLPLSSWRSGQHDSELRDLKNLFGMEFLSPSRLHWGAYADDSPAAGTGLNFKDQGDHYVLSLDLPGVAKEGLELSIQAEQLFLKATREDSQDENGQKQVLQRELGLPADVDSAKAKAEMKNGVLSLRLPKKEEAKARTIPVDFT